MRTKIGLALAVALLAMGCAKMMPSTEPQPAQPAQIGADEWRVPSEAVVISDASGTMWENRTFSHMKMLTQNFVRAMPDGNTRAKYPGNYDASLIGFGGEDRIVSPLAPFNRSALATTAQSLRLLGDIHGYGGTTPFHSVFKEVRDALLNESGQAAIVIFSDGIPQDEPSAMVAAQWVVDSFAGEVCFHTVHVGGPGGGEVFLENISKLTSCGSHRVIADVWKPANMTQFAHDVFAGPAPPPAPKPDPCKGRIVLRGIEFEFDKAKLTGASFAVLDVAISELQRCPNIPVRVEGHTDSIGTEAYNMGLGQRRADSVKSYFVGKGLRAGRITTKSFGESRPIASNDTEEGRQLNRRVELHPVQ